MNYSLSAILYGIAERISEFSNRPIYKAPTQQKCEPPCFFLCLMPGGIRDEIDNRYFSDINIDIVYLQSPNIVNATANIFTVLESLDEKLDTIPYTIGNETTSMIVYNRKHHLEDMDLHYQISLHTRVEKSEVATLMKSMEDIIHVKRQI